MRIGGSTAGGWLALVAVVLACVPGAAAEEEERVVVPAGTLVREVASPVGRVLWTIGEAAALPVLDRSGGWVRVADGERSGWVELPAAGGGEGAGDGAVGGEADGAAVAEAATAADGAADAAPANPSGSSAAVAADDDLLLATADPAAARLLAAAREALAGEPRALRWGRFSVLTGAEEHPLLRLGPTLAEELPALWAGRYGLDGVRAAAPAAPAASAPVLPPRIGTVVLFAREADYRAFLAATVGEAAAGALAGHAGGGVAALPLGGRTAARTTATLVHELTHLLARRGFPQGLPAWLDEGMAGDFEMMEIDRGGAPRPERWAAGPPDRLGRRARVGPLLALDRLVADAGHGRLESLAELAALDRSAFAASARSLERYALAALWVRYLLDDPARAAAFRAFLAALAASPPPADGGAGLLAHALATDLATLDRDFELWLRDLARRH